MILLLAFTFACHSAASSLRDPPLLGDAGVAQVLDGSWQARSFGAGAVTLNATVPGDLVTDLERAGLVGDPLLDANWRDHFPQLAKAEAGWAARSSVAAMLRRIGLQNCRAALPLMMALTRAQL